MIGKARIIDGDLFGIADRLREIDCGYYVVYNYRKGRYEIHNNHQRGSSYCLTVPYGELDSRTVELVRRTRAERKQYLIAEIMKDNANLDKVARDAMVKNAQSQMEQALSTM